MNEIKHKSIKKRRKLTKKDWFLALLSVIFLVGTVGCLILFISAVTWIQLVKWGILGVCGWFLSMEVGKML